MSDYFVGEIRLFGGNFAPVNFLPCDGRTVAISQYETLYSLIGITWGGDGVTTFGLPDLRGRAAIGQGSGPGLTPRVLAQTTGTETVALDGTMVPAHTHAWNTQATTATSNTPTNNLLAQLPTGSAGYVTQANKTAAFALDSSMVQNTGGNGVHDNVMPSMALTYMICTVGLYPTRP